MAFRVKIWVQKSVSHAGLLVVIYAFVGWEGAQTWNYEYSQSNMTWPEARVYCQNHYTDLVAIQNQEEINHLNQVIPRNPTYYWIGIRKIAGVWTWVGTNKSLDKKAENWAQGEPTPGGEDCVEIYIKRDRDAGRWNNDPCTERQKRALCYLASCKPTSCENGECVETIGNYTCQCNEGFSGSECEHAVRCDVPKLPAKGYQNCSHPGGDFTFRSVCVYSCAEGFSLVGSERQQCESSGKWSSPVPTCEAVSCDVPKLPANGYQNCSHPGGDFTFRSVCVYSCAEGFSLVGSERQQCESSGKWSSPVPTCEAVRCDVPKLPANGYQNCSHPGGDFTFRSVCVYSCAEGFSLIGSESLQCNSSGKWSSPIPTCEAVKCDVPKLPANGYQNCSHVGGNFTFRSVCVYSCAEGFSLNGLDNLQCNSSGRWSSPTPTCEAVRCEVPKLPKNGYQNCSHVGGDFTFRSVCVYSCAAGFSLNGSESLQCDSSGRWSSPIPTCEDIQQNQFVTKVAIGTGGASALLSLPFIGYLIKLHRRKAKNERLSL
ncbi:L-selectin-like isoform X1 [Mobula hypostoma]|uniref:L-selectin-like isoform X1 n=1 Tax=Mobula hypostoma TaxID=723540 RepID=UPI002FC3907E